MVVDPSAIVIDDATENTVCEFTIDDGDDVAFYREVDSTVRPIPAEEAMANARLFMAAPELLKALKECVDNFNFARIAMDGQSRELAGQLVDGYRKVIAKAEGGVR